MPAPTDYHTSVRDAVADAVEGLALGCPVARLDAPEDADRVTAPAVVVCPVGPLAERPEFGTNARKGRGYPVVVALLQQGTTQGEKAPQALTATLFREYLDNTFAQKRLPGVTEVGLCEVADAGPLWDEKSPAFQKLAAAMVVTAIGRFPRS